MDTMTSRHGLSTVISTSDAAPLTPELRKELEALEQIFTIDTAKLKQISKRFEEELQEGQSPPKSQTRQER